jgi:site-specific DNA-methyltransferase (adenine-specific)
MDNILYTGDNLYYLDQMIEDGLNFDLILTDPPYNIGKEFGNDTDQQPLDFFFTGS